MRGIVALAGGLAWLISGFAWAEPGYRWEMRMEVEGMAIPGMGGGQAQCLPARGSETPGMDEKCTLLESKRSGNRYRWKARCDGSVATGDFTYLGDSSFKGTMTVEEGRETMTMKMSGTRLGKCEYSPPRVAMPDMSESCTQAVRDLEPELVFARNALCGNQKKEFCSRLGGLTPERFARVADRVKYEDDSGRATMTVKMRDALKSCSVRLEDLRDQQCRQNAGDCDFVGRYCGEAAKAACKPAGRDFSGRAYSSPGGSGGGGANPLSEGMNKLKGLFGF